MILMQEKEISALVNRVAHIANHIDHAIHLINVQLNYPEIEFIYALDFYDLNQYAFPNRSYLLRLLDKAPQEIEHIDHVIDILRSDINGMEIVSYHGCLRQLFEINSLNYVLLPPYLEELVASLRFYVRSKKYNYRRNKLKKLSLKFLSDQKINDILQKYHDGIKFSDEDVNLLKDIVLNNYIELISLSSISEINGELKIGHLLKSEKIISEPHTITWLSKIWSNIENSAIHSSTKTDSLFREFNKLKPNKRLANYIDATALQYVNLFNDRASTLFETDELVDRRYILLLLSSAKAITEVSKSESYKLGDKKILDSIVIHPETLFWLNLYFKFDDVEESKEKLEKLRDDADFIVSSFNEQERTKSSYLKIKSEKGIDLFESWQITLFELIKYLWTHLNISAYADTVKKLEQRSSGNGQLSEKDLIDFTGFLLSALPGQLDLTTFYQDIDNEVLDNISRYLEDSGILRALWGFAIHPRSASYIFRIQKGKISDLENIIFGPDIGEIEPSQRDVRDPEEIKRILSAFSELRGIISNGDNPNAFYLAAHVLEKSNNFKQALKFIENGKSVCEQRKYSKKTKCYQRLSFLQNMIWIREREFESAIKQCKELSKNPFQLTPKFKLQEGYLYWRKFKHEKYLSGSPHISTVYKDRLIDQSMISLEEAIRAFREAYDISINKKNFENFRRCRRLVLADLVITCSYKGCEEDAKKYSSLLEEELSALLNKMPKLNLDVIAVFIAARVSVPWCKAKNLLNNIKGKDRSYQIENDIQNSIEELEIAWQKLKIGIGRAESKDARDDLVELLDNITKTSLSLKKYLSKDYC